MSNSTETHTGQSHPEVFIQELTASIHEDAFVKLILGKYRGSEPGLKKIVIKPVIIKQKPSLSFVYVHKTKDITKNDSIRGGLKTIQSMIGGAFKSAHLVTRSEHVQIEFSKKGKCTLGRSRAETTPSGKHDREKSRLISPNSPYLASLGVTTPQGNVIPSMSRKWKQINKFVELFDQAYRNSALTESDTIRVVDFGSGKATLTFSIHNYLQTHAEKQAEVTGIELREELVTLTSGAAAQLKLDGLAFIQGDITNYTPTPLDVLIALHACDTATDEALSIGIQGGAQIIMCSPCCHKEIRPQLKSPDLLKPLLKFGIHQGQEAEMITDSIRAVLLEMHGYTAQLIEFVSLEHTSKNKLLLAVKHSRKINKEALTDSLAEFKSFYGIDTQHLETLLNETATP